MGQNHGDAETAKKFIPELTRELRSGSIALQVAGYGRSLFPPSFVVWLLAPARGGRRSEEKGTEEKEPAHTRTFVAEQAESRDTEEGCIT